MVLYNKITKNGVGFVYTYDKICINFLMFSSSIYTLNVFVSLMLTVRCWSKRCKNDITLKMDAVSLYSQQFNSTRGL